MLTSTDAAGRTTTYVWCSCGALESLTDAANNTTNWNYDVEGRVSNITMTDANANTDVYGYAYNYATNQLSQYSLPDGNTTTYSYNSDNTVAEVSYSDYLNIPTPTIYTYDPIFKRMSSMSDGLGTYNYTYGAVASGNTDANQLINLQNPWPNATLHYSHDALGRLLSREVTSDDGTAVLQSESYVYDTLNRVTSMNGTLGNFSVIGYNGNSTEIANVTYPNNMTVTMAYLSPGQGGWLQMIQNKAANGNLLSQGNYTHRADGSIQSWLQQYPWAPNITAAGATQQQLYTYQYDRSGWLTEAKWGTMLGNLTPPETAPEVSAVWEDWTYGYDGAGNRVLKSVNGANVTGAYGASNQLTALNLSGLTRVAGWTDEPASIAISSNTGNITNVSPRQWSLPGGQQWAFAAALDLPNGTSNVTISATPAAGSGLTPTPSIPLPRKSNFLSVDHIGHARRRFGLNPHPFYSPPPKKQFPFSSVQLTDAIPPWRDVPPKV
jgi:YD repeat-containing protein